MKKLLPNENSSSKERLVRMVTKLFELWNLSFEDQMALLGLSEEGEYLIDHRDFIERVKNILTIHASLRILFHQNRELVYAWPVTPNLAFDGKTPVSFMIEKGSIGIAEVRRYLDFERGR